MENRDDMLKKMRAGRSICNNGKVLKSLNWLRIKYEKLSDVKYALSDITEDQFLDSINFLEMEGYILLRDSITQRPASLADSDWNSLEAKISGKGVRLYNGELSDKSVEL